MSFSGVTDPQLMAQASLLTGLPQLHSVYTTQPGLVTPEQQATASTEQPTKSRQRQVPIARQAGATGYEKPERARTSHACEPCRERKTKCDGERPACRRCLHNGTGCHYGYGKGWKKRKAVEDLSVTSRKLACYENLLTEILPLVSDNVRNMIEEAQAQFDPLPHMDAQESSSMPANQVYHPEFQPSPTGLSRPLPSLPLPLPPPGTLSQSSVSPFISTPRSLPQPLHTEQSGSPLYTAPGSQRLSRSPEDPNMNPALRLPSITRTGLLVGGVSQNQAQPQNLSATSPGQYQDVAAKSESNS